jgi:hypothetical protein
MTDQIGTTDARPEGFYWVVLDNKPPEIAYWERGEWLLAGDGRPWRADAGTVVPGVQAAADAGGVTAMPRETTRCPEISAPACEIFIAKRCSSRRS